MSSIVTNQGILHYESVGRGRPLILLHGWINSWDVWREAMMSLAENENHRVYALDFWGFGRSTTRSHDSNGSFKIANYVEMVRQFMDDLGIARAPVAGHSLGGTVALQMALTYPHRISKVVLVGAPIRGRSLNPFLKLAGYSWIASLVWRTPMVLSAIMYALLAGDSKQVRNMIFRDVKQTSVESFFRSIGDLRDIDLGNDLERLTVPVLGIYGQRDNIVSPTNAKLLENGAGSSRVIMMAQSRHFPMNDEPRKFVGSLTDFLAG